MPPRFHIVIVSYRAGDELARCIRALAGQSFTEFSAIVVDNSACEGHRSEIVFPDARFAIVSALENLGFAGGSNLGLSLTDAPYCVTLNPDCIPAFDWLARIAEATVKFPDAAMLSSRQVMADSLKTLDGCGDCLSIYGIAWRGGYGMPVEVAPASDACVFGPCGAAAVYKTDAFRSAGGFDESFFCYLEDVDLSIAIRLANCECIYVADAEVLHVGSLTTGKDSEFQVFQSARNNVWMVIKSFPLLLMPATLLFLLTFSLRSIQVQHGSAQARARMRGLRAGLKGGWRVFLSRKISIRGILGSRAFFSLLVISLKKVRTRPIVTCRIPQKMFRL